MWDEAGTSIEGTSRVAENIGQPCRRRDDESEQGILVMNSPKTLTNVSNCMVDCLHATAPTQAEGYA